MYNPEIVASRLKELRHEKGITQKELAENANLGLNTIKQYESGKRVPEKFNLSLLANYFGVYEDWITGESEHKDIHEEFAQRDPIGAESIELITSFKRFIKIAYGCDIDAIADDKIDSFYKELESTIKTIHTKYV